MDPPNSSFGTISNKLLPYFILNFISNPIFVPQWTLCGSLDTNVRLWVYIPYGKLPSTPVLCFCVTWHTKSFEPSIDYFVYYYY